LYDHIIDTVDVELQFGTGVRVAETELSFLDVASVEPFEELGSMKADTAEDFLGCFCGVALDAESIGDGPSECGFGDCEDGLGAFFRLGEVELKKGLKVLVDDA